MKTLITTLVLATVVATPSLFADTLTVGKLEDPARNRLLTISTGETMLPGTVSFGIHEIFLGQLGFTTGENLQWNASLALTPFPVIGTGHGGSGIAFIPYLSAGAKWQFTQQRGGLGNMSLSSDLGTFLFETTFNNTTINSTWNLGSVGLHAGIGLLTEIDEWHTWLQGYGGVDVELGNDGQRLWKLMVEGVYQQSPQDMSSLMPARGGLAIRRASHNFIWDIGAYAAWPELDQDPGLIPYGSLTWIF
ncbi:MAG: hypothetical protein AB7H80_09195 [Candidatus Kapaibacterium sp.]